MLVAYDAESGKKGAKEANQDAGKGQAAAPKIESKAVAPLKAICLTCLTCGLESLANETPGAPMSQPRSNI